MSRQVYRVVAAVLLTAIAMPAIAQSSQYQAQSTHYLVTSEISDEHAQAVSDRMEAMLSLYNQHFRYPIDRLDSPMRVRIFATESRFDSYLRRLVDETRDGYVYLHYNDIAKNELVGYYVEDESLDRSMIHQSFVQFFRAFVAEPPLWLREGFAVYFEDIEYDPEFGTAIYHENLAWLDTLKAMVAGESERPLIPLDEMLSMDLATARANIDSFYPMAWGMVSFLINAEIPEINRIVWDSLSALESNASLDENEAAVYEEAFRWANEENLTEDFLAYLENTRSFRGWISYGIESYDAGEVDEAEAAFVQSLKLREDNYVPYYYLGLINYERQNYGLADFYYQSAMDRGSEQAVTLYALGVNAYADNRFDEAAEFLQMTVDEDPAYRERAEGLLVRIQG